jgi:hypothetical protein
VGASARGGMGRPGLGRSGLGKTGLGVGGPAAAWSQVGATFCYPFYAYTPEKNMGFTFISFHHAVQFSLNA